MTLKSWLNGWGGAISARRMTQNPGRRASRKSPVAVEILEQRQLLSATITTVSSADELLAPSSSIAYAAFGSGTDTVPASDFSAQAIAYAMPAPVMQSLAPVSAPVSLVATPLTVPSDFTGLNEFAPSAATDTKAAVYIVPGSLGSPQRMTVTLEAGDAGFKNQFFYRVTYGVSDILVGNDNFSRESGY